MVAFGSSPLRPLPSLCDTSFSTFRVFRGENGSEGIWGRDRICVGVNDEGEELGGGS